MARSRWGTHSKSLVVDNKDSIIGSFNFDPRSSVYSAELMWTCKNNESLAAAVKDDFVFRKSQSVTFSTIDEAKKHEFDNVNMYKRMGYYLVKPFSLLLQSFL